MTSSLPENLIPGAEPWSHAGGPSGALVLHGFTGNPGSMRGVAEALAAAGFRIVLRKPMFHLLNQPTDSRSAWLWQWWALVQRICGKSHAAGGLLAALVYPLELLLVRWRSEGTSTEIMVCERV